MFSEFANSLSPVDIVVRDTPVAFDTMAMPPRPNTFDSVALKSLRDFSSKNGDSSLFRAAILFISSMQ
jgi:hypothetical protein